MDEIEVKDWAKFLSGLPIGLLRSAFEKWNRTGLYFPKMRQISDLLGEFKSDATIEFRPCHQGGCINGWVTLEVSCDLYKSGKARRAERCECWRAWAGVA